MWTCYYQDLRSKSELVKPVKETSSLKNNVQQDDLYHSHTSNYVIVPHDGQQKESCVCYVLSRVDFPPSAYTK